VNDSDKRFELLDVTGSTAVAFNDDIFVGRAPEGVHEGQNISIGLHIQEGGVSRLHARIRADEAGIKVSDLGSANGTYVNDQRTDGEVLARDGDSIRFDIVEFTLKDHKPPVTRSADESVMDKHVAGTEIRDPDPAVADEDGVAGGTVVSKMADLPEGWLPAGKGTVIVDKRPAAERAKPDPSRFAEGLRTPTLYVLTGEDSGIPHELNVEGEACYWYIGRDNSEGNLQIVLDHQSVSGLHAKLLHKDGKWAIADQMAANKVQVNGKPYSKTYLSSGDVIRFGNVESLFLLPGQLDEFEEQGGDSPAAKVTWVYYAAAAAVVAIVVAAWLVLG